MDELELLKKDWKIQEENLPKLSYNEIYKMILKKSSSIVKWIFIISVIEFVLWTSIDIIFRLKGTTNEFKVEGLENYTIISSILSYSILIYFMVRFYLNYRRIKITDSASVLMKNILNTRKTVKQYVWINIGFLTINILFVVFYMMFFTDKLADKPLDDLKGLLLVLVTIIVLLSIAIGILILIYRLIYGILTRKLKKNYKELQKLEM